VNRRRASPLASLAWTDVSDCFRTDWLFPGEHAGNSALRHRADCPGRAARTAPLDRAVCPGGSPGLRRSCHLLAGGAGARE
jgi:hypothetical protein